MDAGRAREPGPCCRASRWGARRGSWSWGTHSDLMLMDGGDLGSQRDWVRQEQRQESQGQPRLRIRCEWAQRPAPRAFTSAAPGFGPRRGPCTRVSSHRGWGGGVEGPTREPPDRLGCPSGSSAHLPTSPVPPGTAISACGSSYYWQRLSGALRLAVSMETSLWSQGLHL